MIGQARVAVSLRELFQLSTKRGAPSLGYKLNKVLRKASATEQKGSSLFVFLVLRLTPGQ